MVYEHNEAQNLTNKISDQVLKWLTLQNKNFKFIVNCLLM
jgi:dynein light chain Tctex-type 1